MISRLILTFQLLRLCLSSITNWNLSELGAITPVCQVFRKHGSPGDSHSHCGHAHPGCSVVIALNNPCHCYGNCKPFWQMQARAAMKGWTPASHMAEEELVSYRNWSPLNTQSNKYSAEWWRIIQEHGVVVGLNKCSILVTGFHLVQIFFLNGIIKNWLNYPTVPF